MEIPRSSQEANAAFQAKSDGVAQIRVMTMDVAKSSRYALMVEANFRFLDQMSIVRVRN